MQKWTIIANNFHPAYELLSGVSSFLEFKEAFDQPQELEGKNIIDLTILPTANKEMWLEHLQDAEVSLVISELGPYWVEKFYLNFPFIVGAVSTSFYSPTQKFEFHWRRQEIDVVVATLENALQLKGTSCPQLKLGFPYAQMAATIINEAYFMKSENIAEEDDIDKSMELSGHFPIGPFAWQKLSSTLAITNLLDELYSATGDPRFRVSPELRLL